MTGWVAAHNARRVGGWWLLLTLNLSIGWYNWLELKVGDWIDIPSSQIQPSPPPPNAKREWHNYYIHHATVTDSLTAWHIPSLGATDYIECRLKYDCAARERRTALNDSITALGQNNFDGNILLTLWTGEQSLLLIQFHSNSGDSWWGGIAGKGEPFIRGSRTAAS